MAYRKADGMHWSFREGKAVIKDPQNGLFFPLDEVASLIWDMIDGVSTIDDIVQAILKEYDVDAETARRDAEAFIAELADLHLISN